jgi:Carboxypeptidase regulatory-like domain/TonB dependent receptor/TonB-dependent Receptor Plug Domain
VRRNPSLPEDLLRLRELVCAVFLSFLFIHSSFAQSPSGTISGIVTDPSGAAIAEAEILVVNDTTRVQYPGRTNQEGIYLVSNLPPGSYRLQVSKLGFKTIIKPDVTLNVQDALALNFSLPLGAVSEVVTIQGGAPLVNTETASVGTVIDRQFVETLPLNGRSFNTLLQLTPGVVVAPSSSTSPGQFSVAGQRTDANNFTIDGVSANFGVGSGGYLGNTGSGSTQAFSALGATSSLVSVDALQEFRVETSSFAPEFGRAPGGQVILVTRSGTNDFHGEVFDYFRNTVMDANDWFANRVGNPRAAEHHNDFGGLFGGPIRKNRTFFFFSYEGARLDLPQTAQIDVPSLYARQNAPSSLAPFVNAYPTPNSATATPGVFTDTFTGTYANRATLNATSMRIDHALTSRLLIFGRYNEAPSNIEQRMNNLADVNTLETNTRTATVGLNMMLSSGLSNSIRANYSTQSVNSTYKMDSFGGTVPLDPASLLGSLPASDSLAYFQFSDAEAFYLGPYTRNKATQFNFTDDLSVSAGSHALKFGGDDRALFMDQGVYHHGLYYYGPTVEEFLSTSNVTLSTGNTNHSQILSQALSLYAQDTWRVKPRLTLTYGLRWELNPAPSPRNGTVLAAWKNIDDPASLALAPLGTPVYATTYGNVAPRAGMALKLDRSGTTVLRAGWGLYYDLGTGAAASMGAYFPNSSDSFTPSVAFPVPDPSLYLAPITADPPYGLVQAMAPDLKLPRSYQWNVALEKSFAGQVVTAAYVGQAGRELLRNEAIYQPNANFESAFQVNQNSARSNYTGLQLQYRRPLSHGVQILANYTLSHALDNASDDVISSTPGVIISGASDYASSKFDVRHSFSSALSVNLPTVGKNFWVAGVTKDWSLQSVMVARSGFPFNAVIYGYSPGGYATSRPDLVPGESTWLGDASAPGGKSLNSAAFAVPDTTRQGTEGRNDIRGFGLTQMDLSLGRLFPIRERCKLQFRVDVFNLLNHPNFTNPSALIQYGSSYLVSKRMLNNGLGGLNPLFQQGGPRSMQLSAKISF